MSEAEHITEIQDIKSLNTPCVHFYWERVLSHHVFHSKRLQDQMTKLRKNGSRGWGGTKHSELFPPVPSFQKSTGKNMGPAEPTVLGAALR